MATASLDGSVRLWRLDGGSDPVVFRSHTGSVESVTFSGDGFRLLSAGSDGTARSWRIDGSGTNLVIRTPAALYSAEFSPDLEGSRIITAGADGTAQIWRSDGTGPSAVLKGHDGRVNSAAFNADGTRAITAGTDKTARVWRLDGPIDSLVLRGHEGAVLKASFGSPPEGKSAREIAQRARWPGLPADVITAGEEGTACVWSNDGGLPLVLPHIARRGAGGVNSAAFSPDGTRVVTAGDDGRVLVWQIGSPKARQ